MNSEVDIQKTMQAWADMQKQIWDRWLESLGQGKGVSASAMWANGLEHWKESVDRTLDYQKQSLETWAKSLEDNENTPPEMKQWAREGVSMVEGWVDAERKLWDQWFDLMSGSTGEPKDPMQVSAEQWRQFGERMLQMQSEFASAWTGAAKGAGRSGGSDK